MDYVHTIHHLASSTKMLITAQKIAAPKVHITDCKGSETTNLKIQDELPRVHVFLTGMFKYAYRVARV